MKKDRQEEESDSCVINPDAIFVTTTSGIAQLLAIAHPELTNCASLVHLFNLTFVASNLIDIPVTNFFNFLGRRR
jgi:hypothetical protein